MQLICADCVEAMKEMADNSVDAIVTDPPYGLSFMGKKWDYDVPSVEVWQEALRVLKPGGYLLAFAGTRTQHRMACRIEDAGFEIRDMIAWVYGSGFPKSLNIGKGVDKAQGNERTITGTVRAPGYASKNVEMESQNRNIYDFVKSKGTSEWEGWGTALKPALEPITVARKPLSENTVATNCLKWGTGGINIDGCRIPTEDNLNGGAYAANGESRKQLYGEDAGNSWRRDKGLEFNQPTGRFPANLIHDGSEEVLAGFPESQSSVAIRCNSGGKTFGSNRAKPALPNLGYTDHGSAARFFYCAKASASERNEGVNGGNKHPTVKPVALMEYLVKLVSREGAVVLDPFAGSGTTGVACVNLGRNFIGIERDPAYFELMKTRIETRQTQTRLL